MSNEQEYLPRYGDPITPWHKVFAFIPHNTVDQGWKWLQPIYRRRIQGHDYLYPPLGLWWQYAKEQSK